MNDDPSESYYLAITDVLSACEEISAQNQTDEIEKAQPARPYRARLGRETISLNYVEYRILEFLSSKPYHPFTPRQIAAAVTAESHPVTEDTLRGHIASLREKLGFFSDYIQSVPYIGYCFKA